MPGIYRSQASLAPGIKVRMGVKPQPHAGMGVPQYTWATSPLRRYVDLVNQWQIIACARATAPPPWLRPSSPRTRAVLDHLGLRCRLRGLQRLPERHRALLDLRYLQQQGLTELTASVMKDGLVRADTLPWCFKALGCESLPRGPVRCASPALSTTMTLAMCTPT